LTRRGSRENISGTIGRMDAKGNGVTGVARRFSAQSLPGVAAIFARNANPHHVREGRASGGGGYETSERFARV
jgi:hypothetical protein